MARYPNANSTELAQDRNRQLARMAIKNLPIWQCEEAFHVEVKKFKHDLEVLCKSIDSFSQRVQDLPNLKVQPISSSPVLETDDVEIKIFRKIDGEFVEQREATGEEHETLSGDPLKDESLIKLEQKVKANEEVYAMLKPKEPWVRCRVYQVVRKLIRGHVRSANTTFRLKRTTVDGESFMDVNKYSVARVQYHGDSLRPCKRVIAGPHKNALMPGIIGFRPNTGNRNRYMVLMDDGSTDYFKPDEIFPIIGQSATPWNDSRFLNHRADFNESRLRHFFSSWPKRHLLQVEPGVTLTLLRNEELVSAHLLAIDCDVLRVRYEDGYVESVHRGSPRLTSRSEETQRQLRNVVALDHFHNEIKMYLYFYQKAGEIAIGENSYHLTDASSKQVLVRPNQNTARKSTTKSNKRKLTVNFDGMPVEENLRKIQRYNEERFAKSREHKCSRDCLQVPGIKTETSVDDLITDFMEVSALKVPLLLGWKRNLHDLSKGGREKKIVVVYESPCGKLFTEAHVLNRHLILMGSKFDIDYFTFDREIELNRKLGDFQANYHVQNIAVDKRTGRPLETKHISLLNRYTEERMPIDFEYRNDCFPHPMLMAKGFSFNTEFKSGCDCEDECLSRANGCQCHINNAEFYLKDSQPNYKISSEKDCQYKNKRLVNQVHTGLFECNSLCACSSKCGNRVVQNGIKFRLQVYKTLAKGWGVITLDDIPAGAFICTYAAELLDDADQYGDSDMYYADLDYISVNEAKKLGLDDDDDEGEREVVDSTTSAVRLHDYLDSHDFTLDARMQGNVGRFFNHSCDPNAIVQNVFIETHDLRFPVVAFFATKLIKACEEITWNYNYKMGSIEGRRIECHCGAPNCEGRIL